ncbi:MAG: preprotein translocase subunit SecE [Oscillospiraceae bacterium]|nr:preprotein translocase subunit SecE [Oscillospiraceae bacterium]
MAEAKKQEAVKENFFKRTAKRFSKWLREMKSELKKVVWPTRNQVVQNTLVVLACVLVVGVIIWIFDAVGYLVIDKGLIGHLSQLGS